MLAEIEALTRRYASARTVLRGRMDGLQAEVDAARRRRLPGIRKAVAAAAAARDALQAAISGHPDAFVRPRTLVVEGVRIGFVKQKGRLVFADRERVVALIRRHFPEQAEVLVKVTEAPVRAALARLPASDLKRLGVSVEETGDAVVIKPTDSETDKLVAALLDDADRSGGEAA